MGRPTNPSTVYLDSCVLIRAIIGTGSPEIPAVIRLIEQDKLTGMISNISFVEVLGKERRDPLDAALESRVQALLNHPRLIQVDFGPRVAMRARGYALHRGLKPMDAIHLASAVDGNADVLMTVDGDFKKGERVDGVWIDEPYEPGPPALPGT